jgi:hypothetical protein
MSAGMTTLSVGRLKQLTFHPPHDQTFPSSKEFLIMPRNSFRSHFRFRARAKQGISIFFCVHLRRRHARAKEKSFFDRALGEFYF